ncbi:MAG: D-alanyl-D-alanine carboxypeptidase/D-alanyl-D-alanine-endopeptidase [Sulfuricella denitrificans]|nr:D-alanyl-D-alanine carboxypeptidase/D-alanyl-D-alanine-endopeptidase [Sulfuricella denitrificans]
MTPWRRCLLLCFSLWCLPAAADSLPASVRTALREAGLPAASLGVWVQDTQAKEALLEAGAERAMNPASTMKLVTTYAALELLGPAYRWKTESYATEPLAGEALNGSLILKGYGDPRLTLENFWLLLRDLRQRGVRDIRGGVILDQSYFEPAAHDPAAFDNEPLRAYNAFPQALLVNFNAIRVRLLPQADNKSLRAVADPAPPSLKVLNNIEMDAGPCGDWREGIATEVKTAGAERALTLRGRFPVACGEKSFNLNLLPNGSYVDGVFRLLWEELGGTLNGSVRAGELPPGALLLARFDSPPLGDAIRDINKFSNNVMARQLFLTLGAEQSGPPATPHKGAEAIENWLAAKGMNFPELVLENGSGLSRLERISPRHLGMLLASASNTPVFGEFESSLPIVAVDGTMKKRLRDHAVAGHAHIKTGSLEGVRSLAGYVFDARGRRMAVVAMVNHPRASAARPALDALLQWVYERN